LRSAFVWFFITIRVLRYSVWHEFGHSFRQWLVHNSSCIIRIKLWNFVWSNKLRHNEWRFLSDRSFREHYDRRQRSGNSDSIIATFYSNPFRFKLREAKHWYRFREL